MNNKPHPAATQGANGMRKESLRFKGEPCSPGPMSIDDEDQAAIAQPSQRRTPGAAFAGGQVDTQSVEDFLLQLLRRPACRVYQDAAVDPAVDLSQRRRAVVSCLIHHMNPIPMGPALLPPFDDESSTLCWRHGCRCPILNWH